MAPSLGLHRRALLRGAGYGLFFLAAYLLALWWLLPYPEIARSIENRLAARDVAARIEGLGPARFLALMARRVSVSPAGDPGWQATFSDARLHVPLLPLFQGDVALGLDARTLGGEVQARVALAGAPATWVTWRGLDLSRLPLPPALSEVPLTGTSAGELTATLDRDSPLQSEGQAEATFQDVKIGAGKALGFPVPEVGLGRGRLRLSVSDGKLEIENATFEDGDLGLEFSGSVLLRPELDRSPVNGMLSLRPNERISQELALVFAVFPGAKASDGRYTARLRGSLGAPRLLAR